MYIAYGDGFGLEPKMNDKLSLGLQKSRARLKNYMARIFVHPRNSSTMALPLEK